MVRVKIHIIGRQPLLQNFSGKKYFFLGLLFNYQDPKGLQTN